MITYAPPGTGRGPLDPLRLMNARRRPFPAPRHRSSATLAVVLALGLAGAGATAAAPAAAPATEASTADGAALDAQRRRLKSRVEALQRDLAQAESSRADAADSLKATAVAISDANRRLHELDRQRQAVEASLAQLEQERAATERGVAVEQALLARLLARRQASGTAEPLLLLLSGRDPAEIGRLLHHYRAIGEARTRMIADLRDRQRRAKSLADEASARRSELTALADEERAQRATLENERRRQADVVARHGAEIKRQQHEIERLRRNDQRLSRLIERLAAMPSAPAGPRTDRGTAPKMPAPLPRSSAAVSPVPAGAAGHSMQMPVRGELAARFGTPRQDGGTTWKGWFIRCAAGAEVRAVAAGRVVYADWLRGFGNLLIVDHGDGLMTLYGNNEALLTTVGETVAAGDPVAQAGSAVGGSDAGVYFEVRHQGRAVDPATWIGR